jgi:hypothetical protein
MKHYLETLQNFAQWKSAIKAFLPAQNMHPTSPKRHFLLTVYKRMRIVPPEYLEEPSLRAPTS